MSNIEYVAEFDVFDRVGPGMRRIEGGDVFGGLGKRGIRLKSEEEKFQIATEAIARQLNEEKIILFSQKDIDLMLDSIGNLDKKKIQYKNPLGYVLGYSVIDNYEISLEKIKKIFRKLAKIQNSNIRNINKSVTQEDIVRYGRLWERILLRKF